jgi:hypothetical protein
MSLVGWFYGASSQFQQHFSYIMAVSFVGGGNRQSLANFIT